MRRFGSARALIVTALVVGSVAHTTLAEPKVWFELVPGPAASGEPIPFELLARVSEDDNMGLIFFGLELTGIATNQIAAPRAFDTGRGKFIGFAGDESQPNAAQIFSSQKISDPTTVVMGLGQRPGSLADAALGELTTPRHAEYDVPMLIARGTLSGRPEDVEPVQVEANVYLDRNRIGPYPPTVETFFNVIPEPAAALPVASTLCLMRRRRRRSSRFLPTAGGSRA